jgi:hypothetical protein
MLIGISGGIIGTIDIFPVIAGRECKTRKGTEMRNEMIR